MMGQGSLKLRILGDFFLVGAFGLVAPAMLAPISRNWSVVLVSVATFVICIAFLWDGLRTWITCTNERMGRRGAGYGESKPALREMTRSLAHDPTIGT